MLLFCASNLTYPKFSTPASNGLSSGVSGGGKMRRERGVHYVSKSGQEQVSDSTVEFYYTLFLLQFYCLTVNYKNAALCLWDFFLVGFRANSYLLTLV